MIKIEKEYIKIILLGSFSSLLATNFFQPLINFFGNMVFRISSIFLKDYNNILYQRIALRDYNLEIFIYLYLFYFSIAAILFVTIYFFSSMRNILHTINNTEKELKEFDEDPKENHFNADDIQQKMVELRKNIVANKKETKKLIFGGKIISIVYILIFLIIGLFNYSTEMAIKRKIDEYENTKRIISPYISEYKEKSFESKFVLIKNEEDYIILRNEMNEVLLEYGLMLIWK